MSSAISVRLIDRHGQRFGAAASAVVLTLAIALQLSVVVAAVGIALALSSALGTRWFVFGRPWPWIRRTLRLGAPTEVEPELGPRFAQGLGAIFITASIALLAAGVAPLAWLPAIAVAVLQAVLATTGFCLGCRLYGFHWWLPAVFDRVVLRRPYDAGALRRRTIGE